MILFIFKNNPMHLTQISRLHVLLQKLVRCDKNYE